MAAVSALLREKSIDALVVAVSMDTQYLAGLYIKPDERFKGIIITALEKDGNNGFAFVPALYKYEFEESVGEDIPFYFWKDEDWFYDSVKNGLDDFGVPRHGKIAFNDSVLAVEAIEFSKRWGYQLENGADILSSLRLIKDEEEIGYLRKVGEITDAALNEVMEYMKPGMTEKQVLDFLFKEYARHGADAPGSDAWGIIAKSENAAIPHYSKMDCELEVGDSLIIDIGCKYKGYHSDVTRTVFVGEPDSERRKVYEIVKKAQQAGIDIVRPGIRSCDVDKAVRDVIEKAGYGPHFFHRTGHGIGLSIHEAPYVSSANQIILKEGMAFSVEPGIYLHGKFGVRIEDIVVVTSTGCETMTNFSKALTVV
jgi:Xaa-Pro aminopeptidase